MQLLPFGRSRLRNPIVEAGFRDLRYAFSGQSLFPESQRVPGGIFHRQDLEEGRVDWK